MPSLAEARFSSSRRASAAAARICGPPRSIEALETVAPWFGTTLVSSWTDRTWLMSRSSSSAAICRSPVVAPWPNSPLPM